MHSIKLMQLLASRICHDLISPIGAIGSSLELLEASQEQDPQIFRLLKESAEVAAKRLSYLRAAFGLSTARHFSSLEDIHTLLSGYAEPHIQVRWSDQSKKDIKGLSEIGHLIANIFLLAVEMLPRGGVIEITLHSSSEVLIQALGKCVRREDVEQAVIGQLNPEDLSPRTIQPFLLYLLAKEKKRTIHLKVQQDKTDFCLSQPMI